jgi:F-type H+-transporting ATPase subunit delta
MLDPLLPAAVPAPVRNFLYAMLANGDITLLDEVFDELNIMAAAAGGPRPVVAEITSAAELSNEERLAIQNRLTEQYGANLDFHFRVDPAIMGGLVVRVGDKLLDTSVASKMAALRQSMGRSS